MDAQLQTHIPPSYINGSATSPDSGDSPDLRERFKTWLYEQFTLRKEREVTGTSKASPPYALISILAGVLMWTAGITVAGVWTVATMSANVQELRNQNADEKQRHEKAEAATEARYTNALAQVETRVEARIAAAESSSSLNLVYIKDIRENLIARGIIKKGTN